MKNITFLRILRITMFMFFFGMFFLKIESLYYYLPILPVAAYVVYKDYQAVAPEKRITFILPRLLFFGILIFMFLIYRCRV